MKKCGNFERFFLSLIVEKLCIDKMNETNKDNKEFDRKEGMKKQPKSITYMLGTFMIFIYVGMGVITLLGFFDWLPRWARFSLGCLFIVYGVWRFYRRVSGMETRI